MEATKTHATSTECAILCIGHTLFSPSVPYGIWEQPRTGSPKMVLGPSMPEFFIHEEMRTKTHPMAFHFQADGFVWFPLLPCKGYKDYQTVPFHSMHCINKLKTSCSNLINLYSPRKSFLISFAVMCNFWISPRYLMPQNRILLSWLTTNKQGPLEKCCLVSQKTTGMKFGRMIGITTHFLIPVLLLARNRLTANSTRPAFSLTAAWNC